MTKKIKVCFLFFGVISITLSCANNSETDNKVIPFQQIKRQSRLAFIRSFTLDESIYKIGRIGLMGDHFVSPDGDVYLKDLQNKVYCVFDSLGNFRHILGKKGKGPGELTYPESISIDPDGNIYVFDREKFASVVYDRNNRFIAEYKFDKCFPRTGNIQFTNRDTLITLFCATRDNLYDAIELFHQLDSNFQIIRSIAIDYPPIYKQLELGNYQFHRWVADDDFIYILHRALPEVYKHDRDGKLVSTIPITQAKHYKKINEKQLKTTDFVKLGKFLSKYSFASGIFMFRANLLLILTFNQNFPSDFTNPLSITREHRTFYYNIVTTNGEEIMPTDSQLPGDILYVTKNGQVYILETDEPGNRKIGVYEIVLEEI
jgi:hypothetical protein